MKRSTPPTNSTPSRKATPTSVRSSTHREKVILTLRAATTPRGALMESVFRDVPYRTGFKHVDVKRLERRVCSTLLFQTDFQLLDLSRVDLRGLGIPPRQLIDATKAYYGDTRMGRAAVRRAFLHSASSLVFAA